MEVDLTTVTNPGPDDWFEPDPEDGRERDHGGRPAEAIANEADDLSAAVAGEEAQPLEANEADVLEQRLDSGIEDEDGPEAQ